MEYQYEILRLDPQHEFMQVKYTANNEPDYFINVTPQNFTAEFLQDIIDNGAVSAVTYWQRKDSHPASGNSIISMTGSGSANAATVNVDQIEPPLAPKPDYDILTHYANPEEPIDYSANTRGWTIGEWDDETKASNIRTHRDYLLFNTDFHGLSDSSMSTDMLTYRQALRDVPQQNTFPTSVTWPTKP